MEMGQLVSSEVLPKVAAELKKSAIEGGAFDKALQGLRVTEGQLATESQRAGDKIFKSGFSEGLSNLYKTLSEILKTSGPQLEKLGRIFERVFNGIAYTLKVLEPLMKFAIDNFGTLFGAAMLAKILTFSKATQLALTRAFLPIMLAVAAMEEIASLFSDKLVGNLEETLGYQINMRDNTTSEIITKEDGTLVMGKNKIGGNMDPNSLSGSVINSMGGIDDWWDMAVPVRMWKALRGVYRHSVADTSSVPTVPTESLPSQQGGNTYIFNNAGTDEMMSIIGYVGATSGYSTTK